MNITIESDEFKFVINEEKGRFRVRGWYGESEYYNDRCEKKVYDPDCEFTSATLAEAMQTIVTIMEEDKAETAEIVVTGSISRGTLRKQDLIPTFLAELRLRSPKTAEEFDVLLPDRDDDPWWGSEEADYALADLIDALDAEAPGGYYFGAHYGNDSDFGFWLLDKEGDDHG